MDIVFILFLLLTIIFLIEHYFSFNTVLKKSQLYAMLFYHLSFSIFYYFLTRNNGGDAWTYWVASSFPSHEDNSRSFLAPGSPFIKALNYPFAKFLGLSFFTGNIMYGIIGFCGFAFLAKIIRCLLRVTKVSHFNGQLLLFIFIPNLHIWTSGVGKDSLIFFALCSFFYCLFRIKTNWMLLAVSAFIIFYIRPHVFIALSASVGACLFFTKNKKVSLPVKLLPIVLIVLVMLFSYETIFNYLGISNLDGSDIEGRINDQTKILANYGSGVDTSSYNFIQKFFTFLFRPLFFDAHSLLSFLASFDNVLILIIFFQVFRLSTFKFIYKTGSFVLYLLPLYFIVASFVLSSIMSNLGIAMRQKTMVIFPLIVLFIVLKAYIKNCRMVAFASRKALLGSATRKRVNLTTDL